MKHGSSWIKCDLHVHTPISHYHNYGDRNDDNTWEKFICDLENLPKEFSVLGINDYLTIDGFLKVIEYKRQGRLGNIKLILPVVELRLSEFAGYQKMKRINYHVIFSDQINAHQIQSQFLNALSNEYTLETGSADPDWVANYSNEALEELGKKLKEQTAANPTLQSLSNWEVGFNNFNIPYEHVKKILNKPQFKGKCLTAIGKGEWEDYRWDSGGAANKRSMINEADFIFLSCESVDKYHIQKKKLSDANVNNRLLDCSDAHFYSDSGQKDRIGNCNTWLKIEPTFNGLKQVLFVPEERISVSETNPDNKAPYQVISHVNFTNGGLNFSSRKIELSSGLNSIIGGKSTGKSLLASLIVKSSDPDEYSRRKEHNQENDLDWIFDVQPDIDFEVHWKDNETTKYSDTNKKRRVTYFPQHYLNSKINDNGAGNKELNRSIRNILAQNSIYNSAFVEYIHGLQEIDAAVASDANLFELKLKELKDLKNKLQENGNSKDIQNNITKLSDELANLKKEYGLTEDDITKHTKIGKEVTELRLKQETNSRQIEILKGVSEDQVKLNLSPLSILNISPEDLEPDIKDQLERDTRNMEENYFDLITKSIKELSNKEEQKHKNSEERILELKKEHEPIALKIKKSTPLKEKDSSIKEEERKLKYSTEIEEKIKEIEIDINNLYKKLESYIDKKTDKTQLVKDTITENPFSDESNQLGICIEHKCKSRHIQSTLKERIKYQSNITIKEYINDSDFNDSDLEKYKNRVITLLEQARLDKIELKGDHKISNLIQEVLANSIYLNYDLKLGKDSFNVMSPGKRALALLRVLVELDQNQHPIILDQPEDDLDNRSVYQGLAQYLATKKVNRQIIVVTHNPNVAVGADSEVVIVANQSGQESNKDNKDHRFEYIYGGLENSFEIADCQYVLNKQGIREHVCEILDGGEAAFSRREKLYYGLDKIFQNNEKDETMLAAE